MRLFWKIFATIFVAFVTVTLLISYFIFVRQVAEAENSIIEENRSIGTFISRQIELGYLQSMWPFELLQDLSTRKNFLFWWVVRDDGAIHLADQASFMKTQAGDYFPHLAKLKSEKHIFLDREEEYGIFMSPLEIGKKRWSFWLAFSLKDIAAAKQRLILFDLLVCLSGITVLGIMLFFIVNHFIKPVKDLVLGTEVIAKGDLAHRVSAASGDELGELARAFNRMADELQKRDARIRSIFEAAQQVSFIVTDHTGSESRILEFSPGAERIFGYKSAEAIGKPAAMLHVPEDIARFAEINETEGAQKTGFTGEFVLVRKSGEKFPALFSSYPICDDGGSIVANLTVSIDISERKRAEEQVRHLQKAESLGRMAGAIAHHFNNLLGVVMGNLELAMFDLPYGAKSRGNIDEALKASSRAADISGLMLAYLGQAIGSRVPVDLSEVCREALPMLTASLPERVHLRIEAPAEGPIIQAVAAQIKRALTNLVANAGEAIRDREGDITVKIHTMSAKDIRASRFYPPEWKSDGEPYACLSISDTGQGMDTETLEKAFDPFFSTKFTGRGLGLAVVLGVVRAHDGAITVETAPGRGAIFRVFLPLSTQELRPPAKGEPVDTTSPKDRKLVLLVDDEPMLRRMAQTMIERLGYEVIAASDGVEAVQAFREHQNQVQCVLLDLTMPRMDGWETLGALRALRPDLPVILASGYDEAQVMQGYHPERPQAFLHKPYQIRDLEAALRAALKVLLATTTEAM